MLLPAAVIAAYMYLIAADQYASEMSFSVRSEATQSPLELLAGIGQVSSGTSSDSAILYEFLGSQQIIEEAQKKLDLRAIFARAKGDWFFSVDQNVSIETLLQHWRWRVSVSQDKGSGVLKVTALAFTPQDAVDINKAILEASQQLVDQLSQISRDDMTRYAAADMEHATKRLRDARLNLAKFRAENRIIDPLIEIQNQGGMLGALQQQLAEALVEQDLLEPAVASASDPRIIQAKKRVQALRDQIEQERNSIVGSKDTGLVKLIGEYEGLALEREFAEKVYVSASAAIDGARTEASRRSKYLAVHIAPTLAETSLYPKRGLIVLISIITLSLAWVIVVMAAYSMRDRG